jgi:hypothetical protein
MTLDTLATSPRVTVRNGARLRADGSSVVYFMSPTSMARKFDARAYVRRLAPMPGPSTPALHPGLP